MDGKIKFIADTRNIKSEELEVTEKTGGDFFDDRKEETSKNAKKATGAESDIANETEEDFVDQGRNPTPFEISRTRFYDSEKKKNEAKTSVFNVLKYLILIFTSLIVGLLAIFGGIWAYKLNNIAEPIGGLKVEVQNLKEDITELKTEIKNLRDSRSVRQ